ncbi:hypothetical protein KFK09_008912 [Dendrobium nobile]|uniref:Uncharacterized protein n=1 Tax=Dendrobium nobile TaxID=94219 RepID=A0A8T3BR89_DENNO|nr:hypothetical protein KFK09_008912 [Dendrobium nobile]
MAFTYSRALICLFLILSSAFWGLESRAVELKDKSTGEVRSNSEGTMELVFFDGLKVKKTVYKSERLSPGGSDPQHH